MKNPFALAVLGSASILAGCSNTKKQVARLESPPTLEDELGGGE